MATVTRCDRCGAICETEQTTVIRTWFQNERVLNMELCPTCATALNNWANSKTFSVPITYRMSLYELRKLMGHIYNSIAEMDHDKRIFFNANQIDEVDGHIYIDNKEDDV